MDSPGQRKNGKAKSNTYSIWLLWPMGVLMLQKEDNRQLAKQLYNSMAQTAMAELL